MHKLFTFILVAIAALLLAGCSQDGHEEKYQANHFCHAAFYQGNKTFDQLRENCKYYDFLSMQIARDCGTVAKLLRMDRPELADGEDNEMPFIATVRQIVQCGDTPFTGENIATYALNTEGHRILAARVEKKKLEERKAVETTNSKLFRGYVPTQVDGFFLVGYEIPTKGTVSNIRLLADTEYSFEIDGESVIVTGSVEYCIHENGFNHTVCYDCKPDYYTTQYGCDVRRSKLIFRKQI